MNVAASPRPQAPPKWYAAAMRPWLRLAFALLLPACHASAPPLPKQETQAAPLDDVVDIGGLALHLRCVGQGEPAVVMEAGLGNDGSVWKHVQPEVARFARACVYDRAGMGRSRGPAPKPHTNRQMARELHALLTRAGLAGPWILVGHSMGGLNVRLLEAEHPEQVAGMVLVDATVDPARTWSLIPDAQLREFKEIIPRLGEGLDFETFLSGAADVRATSRSLGAKPLVVLTRSREHPQPWASPEQLAEMLRVWQELQAELPKLSSNSVQLVVKNSAHYIQLDAPRTVVAAIGEVVRAARTQSRLNAAAITKLNR